MITNGRISFWYADIGGPPPVRPSLPGDMEADVCIIGAGYTGLWSAYYLKQLQPELRIVVLEREFAGFGASGRNGGWLSGGFAWAHERYLGAGGRVGVQAMIRAMATSVDEVIRVLAQEGIAADLVRTDELQVATCAAQWQRVQADFRARRAWGVAEDACELLDAARLGERIRVADARGALMTRHVARVQPARLVQGLARVVEARGVRIFEQTTVTGFRAGRVQTHRGRVKADCILRATEGFTAGLPGLQRSWLPLNSAQIVTEPLPESLWEQIGWQGQELLGDCAHAYCYAQRTREGRIAMGGRGVPYRFGSRTDVRGRTQPATISALLAILHRHFPMTRGLAIDHAWCGVLGVPRDWCASVGLDRKTGIGWAGGYVGVGVSTSNLAGRTLAELVLGQDTERTHLPWVNHRVRDWEPEPLRWLGVHAMYRLYHLADRLERRGGGTSGTSVLARLANRLTGR